jgi:hypothetical protein
MQFHDGCDKGKTIRFCGNLGKSVMKTMAMIRQVKSKVKSMLMIFSDIKGIVHKEFILGSQSVSPTYHCDLLC